jgi:hypothetical protein
MLPPAEIFFTQPSDGSVFAPKQRAFTHVAARKKLIVLNGDRSFCQFAEALGGSSRTLALEEYGLDEFVRAAATLKPICVDSSFFEHMLVFAQPLDFSYSELDRTLAALHVDADTLIMLRSRQDLPTSKYLDEKLDEFITRAQHKGANLVVIQEG